MPGTTKLQPSDPSANAGRFATTRRCRRGLAATEFALILPLLLLLALGFFELCRAVHQHMLVSNAARVGAEYAASHRFTSYSYRSWNARTREAVMEELGPSTSSKLRAKQFDISIETSRDNSTLPRITVTVKSRFKTVFAWLKSSEYVSIAHSVSIRQFR